MRLKLILAVQVLVVAKFTDAKSQKTGERSTRNLCQIDMDIFKEAFQKSHEDYKEALKVKTEQIGEILRDLKITNEEEKMEQFEKLAEAVLENKMVANKLQSNNLLVEVMHLVAMFLGEKMEKVDGKLDKLDQSATEIKEDIKKVDERLSEVQKEMLVLKGDSEMKSDAFLQQAKIVSEKLENLPEVEAKLEKVVNGSYAVLEKLDKMTKEGNEKEKALNSTILEEMGTGLKNLEERLEDNEKKSIARNEQTKISIEELKMAEVSSKISSVHEKIAFFEENLQSQHSFLEKMDNRTAESFVELKTRLKKLVGCHRAVKLNLTTLETGTYYFSNFYLNWTKATEFCKKNGMHLASLETENEMDMLDETAPNQNFYYWLAASDIGRQAGHYYWPDGRRVEKGWWYSGSANEPDSFHGGQETCVFLYTYYGKLFDGQCSGNRYFICELGPGCLD